MSASGPEFRAKIISVSRALYVDKGFEATSMTDVAHAIGVSKPTIYEVFPSKHALLEAVVEFSVNELNMSLTRAAARGDIPFAEYVHRMPEECWQMVSCPERSAMYRLLIQEGPHEPAVAAAFSTRITQSIYAIYEELFARAMQNGECRVLDSGIARRLFMSPVNTVMLQIAIVRSMPLDEASTRSFFNHYFEMLAGYLLPQGS